MNLSRRELLAAGVASVAGIPTHGGTPELTIQSQPGVYAALLDGRVKAVFLKSPPATQNAASEKNGKGLAIEMLSCLRSTDLPHVTGMLYPAEVIIAGEFPSTFAWAEDLYGRLGSSGKFRRVKAMSDWAPSS